MIEQLNPRERVMVLAGAATLILLLLYFAILVPYRQGMEHMDRQVLAHGQQMQKVRELQNRYLGMQSQMARVEKLLQNDRNLSALPFIESMVEETAGREKLVSMRPQTPVVRDTFTIDSIEVKLEKLTLKQLLEFLWEIEKRSTPTQIKAMHLKQRFDDQSLLDATMTVTALRRTT